MQKKRILIVDDMPINIKILGAALRNDYEIRIATNGIDCLTIAESAHKPDLILLDIIMPEMDGYEVCRNLKKNKNTKDIPVIFITAKIEVHDEDKGIEIGAADYITKPFSLPLARLRINNQLKLREQSAMLAKLRA